jgi:hypothetical protein
MRRCGILTDAALERLVTAFLTGQFARYRDARQSVRFVPRKEREAIRTARPDPSLAKKRAAQDDKAN